MFKIEGYVRRRRVVFLVFYAFTADGVATEHFLKSPSNRKFFVTFRSVFLQQIQYFLHTKYLRKTNAIDRIQVRARRANSDQKRRK